MHHFVLTTEPDNLHDRLVALFHATHAMQLVLIVLRVCPTGVEYVLITQSA